MVLTKEQFETLGPEVFPCKRRIDKGTFRGIIKDGEAVFEKGETVLFNDFVHNITASGLPDNIINLAVDDIINSSPLVGKYLWVIDKSGLKIIPESTPNPAVTRKMVCHTNITGGMPALQGGELWFGEDNRVYVNNKSGRYGADTDVQEKAVIAYFISLGLEAVQLPF